MAQGESESEASFGESEVVQKRSSLDVIYSSVCFEYVVRIFDLWKQEPFVEVKCVKKQKARSKCLFPGVQRSCIDREISSKKDLVGNQLKLQDFHPMILSPRHL